MDILSKIEGLEAKFHEISLLITDPAVIFAIQTHITRLVGYHSRIGDEQTHLMELGFEAVYLGKNIHSLGFSIQDSVFSIQIFLNHIGNRCTPSIPS